MSGISDPIADYLTRIRNAAMIRRKEVHIPASNLKVKMTEILKKEGFIEDFSMDDDGKSGVIKIILKYTPKGGIIFTRLKRISKPGRRIYVEARELRGMRKKFGILIISTSQGVITDREAILKNTGGEVLCEIW